MKKRWFMSVFFFIVIIGTISSLSASLYFSGLQTRYNLGDMISLNVQVEPVVEGRLLKTILYCNEGKIIEFNNLPDESANVIIKLPLNTHTINQIEGNCYFLGDYSGESRKSELFEISRRLETRLYNENFVVNPGEEVLVTGTAHRLNQEPINGEVQITIPLLKKQQPVQQNTSTNETGTNQTETNQTPEQTTEQPTNDNAVYYGKVQNGEFSIPVMIGANIPSGNYRIDVLAYETVAGERASEGGAFGNLEIRQILTSVDIALSKQIFDPGENIELKPMLLDQAGMAVDNEVSVIIYAADLFTVFEKIVKSQETLTYTFPTNLTSGYYEIEARNGDKNILKKIYLSEKAILSFVIENQTLLVTNIGNIPYNRDIEITIANRSFVKRIDLLLGESQKFKLSGSNNVYDIKVTDGETEFAQSGITLTGYSLKVDSLGSNTMLSSFAYNPIIWIFIIIVLGIGLLFLFRNIFKKKSYAYDHQTMDVQPSLKKVVKSEQPNQNVLKIPQQSPKVAEQTLVNQGKKENAAVLAVKIKSKLEKESREYIQKALDSVYEKKGAVYEKDNFIYAVFAPSMTKLIKNEVEAARIADKILQMLTEYNKKFKDKIEFGMGITSGEIISHVEDKKLKFTALGNIIAGVRRLAELSDKNILVSKEAYLKGGSELKTEKVQSGATEFYVIKHVVDHEKNKAFIQDFLKRQQDRSK